MNQNVDELKATLGSKRIRLIALDLDDTVLLPDKGMSPRTVRAIRAAVEEGCHVVLASARPIGSIAECAKELGVSGYCIGLNGAVVARLPSLERVRVRHLEPELVRRILDLQQVVEAGNLFLEYPRSYAALYDRPDVEAYARIAAGPAEYIGDLHKIRHDDVCKVVFRADETPYPTLEKLQENLGDEVAFVIWEGPWSFIEVLPFGTSKADALQWLTEELGVDRNEVLAVGDERNDLEMLRWAGIGVAMGNAHPEVKAVADWVSESVEADGCAVAIERFVLGKGTEE